MTVFIYVTLYGWILSKTTRKTLHGKFSPFWQGLSTKFVRFWIWRTRTVSNRLKNIQHFAYTKLLMSGLEWLWCRISLHRCRKSNISNKSSAHLQFICGCLVATYQTPSSLGFCASKRVSGNHEKQHGKLFQREHEIDLTTLSRLS